MSDKCIKLTSNSEFSKKSCQENNMYEFEN